MVQIELKEPVRFRKVYKKHMTDFFIHFNNFLSLSLIGSSERRSHFSLHFLEKTKMIFIFSDLLLNVGAAVVNTNGRRHRAGATKHLISKKFKQF